ncbi:hypothetical protein B0H14DRAFT_3667624 [Mycena olivaceomarginata]|nr:hypothetical protein B0H14DRAFT_3667624 [Mycena olivaceomarginata]
MNQTLIGQLFRTSDDLLRLITHLTPVLALTSALRNLTAGIADVFACADTAGALYSPFSSAAQDLRQTCLDLVRTFSGPQVYAEPRTLGAEVILRSLLEHSMQARGRDPTRHFLQVLALIDHILPLSAEDDDPWVTTVLPNVLTEFTSFFRLPDPRNKTHLMNRVDAGVVGIGEWLLMEEMKHLSQTLEALSPSHVNPRTSTHAPQPSHVHPWASTHAPPPSHVHPRMSTHAPQASHVHPRTSAHAPQPSHVHPRASTHVHPRTFTRSPAPVRLHPLVCTRSPSPVHLHPCTFTRSPSNPLALCRHHSASNKSPPPTIFRFRARQLFDHARTKTCRYHHGAGHCRPTRITASPEWQSLGDVFPNFGSSIDDKPVIAHAATEWLNEPLFGRRSMTSAPARWRHRTVP